MSGPEECSELQGKRILVAESEMLLPFTIFRAMELFGAEVVGPVAFPEDVAMLLGDSRVDGAIIDSRMLSRERDAVYTALRRFRVPYVDACGSMSCISGENGCYRLYDAESDIAVLGRALFGGVERAHDDAMPFASARGDRHVR